MRSAYPVSGQRLCLAKSLQVSPEVQGRGADTPVGPLYCFQASASRRAGLEAGLGSGEGTQTPGSAVCAPTTRPDPLRSWGAACHPPSPTHPPTPAGEEPAVPQGIGAGTNGSAEYRCLLIKEPNPFVFPAPILGSLEVQRARSWPGERYQGRDCLSSGH